VTFHHSPERSPGALGTIGMTLPTVQHRHASQKCATSNTAITRAAVRITSTAVALRCTRPPRQDTTPRTSRYNIHNIHNIKPRQLQVEVSAESTQASRWLPASGPLCEDPLGVALNSGRADSRVTHSLVKRASDSQRGAASSRTSEVAHHAAESQHRGHRPLRALLHSGTVARSSLTHSAASVTRLESHASRLTHIAPAWQRSPRRGSQQRDEQRTQRQTHLRW
jgi:hypothetical protein